MESSFVHSCSFFPRTRRNTAYLTVYETLTLMDLCGIDKRNAARLNSVSIFTVPDFCNARPQQLKAAFQSVLAYYWYARLRGWEIDAVELARKSFGNS
jgi:nucleotidyltransferase/DNA polymerase involved in DNA repair